LQTSRHRLSGGRVMADSPEDRGNRAMALMLAAVSWKGDPADSVSILGLADDFLDYIEGELDHIPLADALSKGRLPKP
jgi:hypothetical protein